MKDMIVFPTVSSGQAPVRQIMDDDCAALMTQIGAAIEVPPESNSRRPAKGFAPGAPLGKTLIVVYPNPTG